MRSRRAAPVGSGESAPGITFSCGVAAATSADAVAVQEFWERADAALYEAKHRGRRQTVSFSAITNTLTVSADKLDAVTGRPVTDA